MRAVAAAIVLAGLIAGCSLLPVPTTGPIGDQPLAVKVVTPPAQLRITATNQTSIPVILVVNGVSRNLAPMGSLELGLTDLGPMPWDMRMTTMAGRALLNGSLHDGDVWRINMGNGESQASGFIARSDLSCGLLVITAGGPMSIGPAPGPGVPGDCD